VTDERGQVDGDQHERGPSRRALLAGAATGAVAVWATPTILSLDAAAAASGNPCTTQSFTWQSGDLETNNPVSRPIGSSFVNANYESHVGLGTGSAVSPGNTSQTSPLGGVNNLMELDLHITGAGQYESVIFTFTTEMFGTIPASVKNLTFTLLNIDVGNGGADWVDDVRLYGKVNGSIIGGAYTGGTYVPAAFTNTGTDVSTTNNITDGSGTYDRALGTGGPASPLSTSTTGNVVVTFAGPIDYLEIRYIGNGGTQPQLIGISDLSACA
jgi:hypothetical protein